MGKVLVTEQYLKDIADAIRDKSGSTATYSPGEMADAIMALTPASEGESVWFDDRNDDVLGYLNASSTYTAANRSSTSVVSSYADPSVQDQDCPKPFLHNYNLMPDTDNTVNAWTVRTFGNPPRMLKLSGVWNVRDCGGWAADNGKVKYGYLFRGARLSGASAADLTLLANVGIKLELDIRDAANAAGTVATIPGSTYLNVPISNAYAQMITGEATAAANACIAAMTSIVDDKPVYIHCASGADRTGCICAMLEAVLGVSDPDLDREFELTNFADVENLTGHHRNGGSWTGFWAALPTNQGNSKMNVVKFLRDNGATTDLINSFRQKMIDGNPRDVDITTYAVTNTLTDCTTSNNAASVDAGSLYSATISPSSGYTMQLLTVTMGGVDITSTAVSGNGIAISAVTGAVMITGVAVEITTYTNQVRISKAVDSDTVYNNGLGYKNGYYTSVGSESANASDCCTGLIPYVISSDTQPTDIIYIKGYTGAANASYTRLSCWTSAKVYKTEYNGFLDSNAVFDVTTLATNYYKLTPKSGIHHSINNVGFVRFSFNQPDGAGLIITLNEQIT